MITETFTTASALPSVCLPPWAGGEALRGVPLSVTSACLPPEAPPLSCNLAPNEAKCAHAACQDDGLWHWHFHQLLRQLRLAKSGAERDHVLKSNLGHIDSLLGQPLSMIFRTSTMCSTVCGTRASRTGTPRTGSTSCSTKCRWTRSCGPDMGASRSVWSRWRQAPHPHPWQRTGCLPPGEGVLPELGRILHHEPPPRSWPSSVPLGRRGAETWPGASAPSAAHGASVDATDALCGDGRFPFHRDPLRCQHP